MTAKAKITFEEAMTQLETIVLNLEQGDIPLEEALEQFQQGVALTKICKETLENAEKTLATMMEENEKEVPFEQE